MKKRFLLLAAIITLIAGSAPASYGQLYDTGIGARLGFFNGLTVKHFLQEDRAIEGILSSSVRWQGLIVTGLYEFQRPFPDVDNLEWFFGGGVHVGVFQEGRYRDTDVTSLVGISLIAGVEYTFEEFPFSVSLDWKPAFNILGRYDWWGDQVALSVRYTLR